jgi:tRNA threonylcarbamoyladenosine biosynthesis protein TsaB
VAALAVGTGPGSFTGLRVGLATAKIIAYARDLPLLGVPTSDALRRAALAVAPESAAVAIVLPAGVHDHYLVRVGQEPILVAPGGLEEALGGDQALSVDMDPGPAGEAAARLGEAAVAGLPAALLALAARRLAVGELDAPAGLVPAYVALPRGVSRAAEELRWSPYLR